MAEAKEDPKRLLKLRGGGSLVGCRPLFASDPLSEASLLCGSGDQIKIFNRGECTRNLKGHEGKVTSIILYQQETYQVLSSSLDGSIIRWNWKFGGLLHRYRFENPIFALYSCGVGGDKYFAITGPDPSNCSFVEFTISKMQESVVEVEKLLQNVDAIQDHNAVGCRGEYVASIQSKSLHIFCLKTNAKLKFNAGRHTKLTCIDCHPKEYTIATGCEDGQIILWRNFCDEKSTVIKTVEHWHSLSLRTLAFTSEGSQLLSGGYECVLVKWYMPDLKKRDTLPRLGAPIVNIACSADSTLFAVCYIDNGLQVIDNRFAIRQTYHGLVQAHFEKNLQLIKTPIATGLHFDPRTGCLVLNGRPGHLQFYDVKREQQLYSLDVVEENYVSPEDLKNPVMTTEVENLTFDATGNWMATIERRVDGNIVVQRLRFWHYSKESQMFVLNTILNRIHDKKVHTLKFRYHNDDDCDNDNYPLAVTTCDDGTFKLYTWEETIDTREVHWVLDSKISYHGRIPGPADFSQDGSLLAIGMGDLMTIWDPETLRDPWRVVGEFKGKIQTLVYSRGYFDAMIIFATENELYAWNTITKYNQWVIPLDVQVIVANPKSEEIAVFSNDQLLVFVPKNGSKPVSSYAVANVVKSAAFDNHGNTCSISDLYYITADQELYSLVEKEEEITESVRVEQKLPVNWYVKSQNTTGRAAVHADDRIKTVETFVKQLIETPVNAMPPMLTILDKYFELLGQSDNI